MTAMTTSQPVEVWQLMEAAGANEDAIAWARPFGTDLERMWRECTHGELMLGFSAKFWVPPVLLGWAGAEIIRDSLPEDLRVIDPLILDALDCVEDWLSSDDLDDLDEAHENLLVCVEDADRRQDGVNYFAAQSIDCLVVGMNHSFHKCSTYPGAMAALAMNAAKICAALSVDDGERSNCALESIQTAAVARYARTVRNYVPFSMLATSALGYVLAAPFGDA